jgi:hypothetical protein
MALIKQRYRYILCNIVYVDMLVIDVSTYIQLPRDFRANEEGSIRVTPRRMRRGSLRMCSLIPVPNG